MKDKFLLLFSLFIYLHFQSCVPQKNVISDSNNELSKQSKYIEKNISILTCDSLFLRGTLQVGNSEELVIILSGSGPTDRNGDNLHLNLNSPLHQLADGLFSKGISVFRFDKRGIGQSSKCIEEDIDFKNYIDDLKSIVSYFKEDYEQIYLFGHSEGALISLSYMQLEEKNHISGLILSNMASKRIDSLLYYQLDTNKNLLAEAKSHFAKIQKNEPLDDVSNELQSVFRASSYKYLKSLLNYNPTEMINDISKKTLLISGGCDFQVPYSQQQELANNNQRIDLVFYEKMSHNLIHKENCFDIESYGLIEDQLVPSIINFIRSIE